MLTKKLVRHGNSLALVIDKPILEMLNIDETTELSVMSDGKQLVVKPSSPEEHQRLVDQVSDEILNKYERAFRKLAE